MILSTTPQIEGHTLREYKGVVTGETIIGANFVKDFHLWQQALQGHNNVVFRSYPTLNHLFMEGEGKSTPLEYQIQGHVAESVLKDVADFINSRPTTSPLRR